MLLYNIFFSRTPWSGFPYPHWRTNAPVDCRVLERCHPRPQGGSILSCPSHNTKDGRRRVYSVTDRLLCTDFPRGLFCILYCVYFLVCMESLFVEACTEFETFVTFVFLNSQIDEKPNYHVNTLAMLLSFPRQFSSQTQQKHNGSHLSLVSWTVICFHWTGYD